MLAADIRVALRKDAAPGLARLGDVFPRSAPIGADVAVDALEHSGRDLDEIANAAQDIGDDIVGAATRSERIRRRGAERELVPVERER